MGSLDNPVIRLFFIFSGGFTLSNLYIMVTGYLPGSLQWFPFGTFPSFGTLPYIALFTLGTFVSGALWWFVFMMHERHVRSRVMANARVAF